MHLEIEPNNVDLQFFSVFIYSRSSQWPKRTHSTAEHKYFVHTHSAAGQASAAKQQSNTTNSTTNDAAAADAINSAGKGTITAVHYNRPSAENSSLLSISTDVATANASSISGDGMLDITIPPIDVHANHINQSFSSFKAHFQLHQQRHLAAEQQSNHVGPQQLFKKIMSTLGINMCAETPPNLVGPINIDIVYEKLPVVEQRLKEHLQPGGWYKPKKCNAKNRVAIVIPYRDRPNHLPIFLKNIHPFLQKQQIEYGIFVVEQIADGQFNRAALMNVGFVEALKLSEWDCFIFHDIDLLPMDDRNLYTCPDQPRHMSVAVDTMGFKYVGLLTIDFIWSY